MIDWEFFLARAPVALGMMAFVTGIATIFLRRHAAWSLVGQVIAVKAVAACAFLLSRSPVKGAGDLVVLSLAAAGLVPALALVGMLVLHRCGRFEGTLDYEEENRLRN